MIYDDIVSFPSLEAMVICHLSVGIRWGLDGDQMGMGMAGVEQLQKDHGGHEGRRGQLQLASDGI